MSISVRTIFADPPPGDYPCPCSISAWFSSKVPDPAMPEGLKEISLMTIFQSSSANGAWQVEPDDSRQR